VEDTIELLKQQAPNLLQDSADQEISQLQQEKRQVQREKGQLQQAVQQLKQENQLLHQQMAKIGERLINYSTAEHS